MELERPIQAIFRIYRLAMVSVFGGAAALSAVLIGWLSDRCGRAPALAISYFVRGIVGRVCELYLCLWV